MYLYDVSDFHLFKVLKEAIKGRKVSCDDDDVKAMVHAQSETTGILNYLNKLH